MNLPSLRRLAQIAISPTSSSGTVTSVSSSCATTSGSGSTFKDEEMYRSGDPVTWYALWCLLKASRRGFGPPRCEMRTSKASEKSPGSKQAAAELSTANTLHT